MAEQGTVDWDVRVMHSGHGIALGTVADLWRPSDRMLGVLYDALLIVSGSALTALLAQGAIPLPWTPVPVTGQTLAVLLLGALLGARRAAACMGLYLVEGALGLPVFALGTGGVAHLLGPTGGYLWGFIPAAWLIGWLSEHGWDRRFSTTVAAMLAGNALIYLFGLPWLALFVGWDAVLRAGLLPFVPGDLCKLLLAALVLPNIWRWLRRLPPRP